MHYKVGDEVRIRYWDDMASEYKVDCDGDLMIDGNYYFHDKMEFCGTSVTILDVDTSDNTYRIVLGETAEWVPFDCVESVNDTPTEFDIQLKFEDLLDVKREGSNEI